MIGIYFSGTGNTKHCVEKLVKLLDVSAQSFPLEHTEMIQILEEHDIIVLGYCFLSFTVTARFGQEYGRKILLNSKCLDNDLKKHHLTKPSGGLCAVVS